MHVSVEFDWHKCFSDPFFRGGVSEADVEALKSAVLELKGQIKALNQSIFDTFEQSLAPALQVQFRTIVQEQFDSNSYVCKISIIP